MLFGMIDSIIKTQTINWRVILDATTERLSPLYTTQNNFKFHVTSRPIEPQFFAEHASEDYAINYFVFVFGLTFCHVPSSIIEVSLDVKEYPDYLGYMTRKPFQQVISETFTFSETLLCKVDGEHYTEIEMTLRHLDSPLKYLPRDIRQVLLDHAQPIPDKKDMVKITTLDDMECFFSPHKLKANSEYFKVLLGTRWQNDQNSQIQIFHMDYDFVVVFHVQRLMSYHNITHEMYPHILTIFQCAEQYLFTSVSCFVAKALREDFQHILTPELLITFPILRNPSSCPHVNPPKPFIGTVQNTDFNL
jgi:hypothetical protein